MTVTTPLRIAFGPAVCTSLAEGADREWLVAVSVWWRWTRC
jgi:hypothetical protein